MGPPKIGNQTISRMDVRPFAQVRTCKALHALDMLGASYQIFAHGSLNRLQTPSLRQPLSPRRIFERFVELGSATVLARELRREGFRNKQGTLIDKGYLYRLLKKPRLSR